MDKIVDITQFFEQNKTAPEIIDNFGSSLIDYSNNEIDNEHSRLLLRYNMYLSSNDFLDEISHNMRDFMKTINDDDLTLTMKGRIKSMVRLEEKFNGYIIEFCTQCFHKSKRFPTEEEMIDFLSRFKDIIAYRIILSIPKLDGKNKEEQEIVALYNIANKLPGFFTKYGYTIEKASSVLDGVHKRRRTSLLTEENKKFFKDYIERPKTNGYRSLHVSLKYNRPIIKGLPLFSNLEIQLRTFEMDCYAEMSQSSKHETYEKNQEEKRKNQELPIGICKFYDDAVERYNLLHNYDFTRAKIDHFKAIRLPDGSIIYNDHAGIKFGREIDPREFLAERTRKK